MHNLTVLFLLLPVITSYGSKKRYPCLSNKNCPHFSKCYGEVCSCKKDYLGDGEFCQQGKKLFHALYRRIFTDFNVYIFAH